MIIFIQGRENTLQLDDLQRIAQYLAEPFYVKAEFWINFGLGIVGIVFSIFAFLEARSAKEAAGEAGRTVKMQTITIELNEIAQRLDKVDSQLTFSQARDSLNEFSRKLIRLTAPVQDVTDLRVPCQRLREALDSAKESLDRLLPQHGGSEDLPPNSVYFATQRHLADISGLVAEIMGLLEKRTITVDRK